MNWLFSDKTYKIIFFISFILFFYKICIHLGFFLIPFIFLISGFLLSLISINLSISVFLFVFPFINSLPDIFASGYPYNYFALPLFLLSGMGIGFLFKDKKNKGLLKGMGFYKIFLVLIFLSVIFVFLRWSNITLSIMAFFKDTKVSPSGERLSFASLFPILTFFLYSASFSVYMILKKINITFNRIRNLMSFGYLISFLFALIQKLISNEFLTRKQWIDIKQLNGGSSDFNAFGFFSGFIFFIWMIDLFKTKEKLNLINIFFISISFFGIILSASRTAFIFVLVGFIYLIFNKSFTKKSKVIAFILIFLILFLFGGKLKYRIENTINKFKNGINEKGFIYAIDRASNGRISMINNAFLMFKDSPISGVGSGNFLFYLKYINFNKKDAIEDLALNQFLMINSELGITGLLFFILFLIIIYKGIEKKEYKYLFWIFILSFLVGNPLWNAEIMILFWIFVFLSFKTYKFEFNKTIKNFTLILIFSFIVFNIIPFNKIHPLKMCNEKDVKYDYGFWYEEKDNENQSFNWTKDKSGIYIDNLNDYEFKIFCGAPIDKLKDKKQKVDIYFNSKKVKTIVFKENKFEYFRIKDSSRRGFLELRVNPVFNLKQMGIGIEPRTLGVMFYAKKNTNN